MNDFNMMDSLLTSKQLYQNPLPLHKGPPHPGSPHAGSPHAECHSKFVFETGFAYCQDCGFECKNLAKSQKPLSGAEESLRTKHIYEPLSRFVVLLDNFAYIREVVPNDVIAYLKDHTSSLFSPLKSIAKLLASKYPLLVPYKFECFFRLNRCKVPVISPSQRTKIIADFKLFTNAYHVFTKGLCSCPSLNYCMSKLLTRHQVAYPPLSINVPNTLKDYDVVYNTVF